MNCKNTRSCCSPYSVLAQQLEETTERAIQAYNLAAAALTNPVEGLTVDGDLQVNGDILQNGSTYETHAEKVYTNDDYIVMRDGAVSALGVGDYSGFQVKKYDGTNDGRLVVDRDGTARVGDVGDEQPLATRDKSADLTDGHLVKWDATNLKLTDAGISPEGVMELYDEFSVEGENLGAGETQYVTVTLSATKTFAAGYDYFIYARSPVAYANITSDDIEVAANTATFNVIYQPQGSSIPELIFRVYRIQNPTPPRAGYVRISFIGEPSVMDQPKLVSGTNIKTVGGVSLLGSGDVPAGGLTLTLRTPADNWSDMFEVSGTTITAKKNVYLFDTDKKEGQFIPKGFSATGSIRIRYRVNIAYNGGIYYYRDLALSYNNVTGSLPLSGNNVGFNFATDGSTVTTSTATWATSVYKNAFAIYTD